MDVQLPVGLLIIKSDSGDKTKTRVKHQKGNEYFLIGRTSKGERIFGIIEGKKTRIAAPANLNTDIDHD